MSLHPEVQAMIEVGPRLIPDGHIVSHSGRTVLQLERLESHAEFARRIALRAVELERQSNSEAAMKAHGASFDDLHICGNCNGTGYTV